MILAEALNKRKDLLELLSTVRDMVSRDAYDQNADPNALLKKMASLTESITGLDQAILAANVALTVTYNGTEYNLANARAARDRYRELSTLFDTLMNPRPQVYGNQETPVLQLDKDKVFALRNEYAKKARKLDTLLQGVNWTVDISVPPLPKEE